MINKLYLSKDVIREMKNSFQQNGVLLLNDFLLNECYDQTKKELSVSKKQKIPDRFSYSFIQAGTKINLLESKDFVNFINGVLGKGVKRIELTAKRFGHRDYTLIHDEDSDNEGIELFFFLCDTWKKEWGGVKVYSDSKEEDPLVFVPQPNSFCLIKKKKNWNSFVKYVNNHAEKNSFIIVEGKVS